MKKLLATMMILVFIVGGAALAEEPSGIPDGIQDDTMIFLEEPYDTDAANSILNEQSGGKLPSNQVVVQTLSEALLMLTSGRADAFRTFYDSARYLASRNDGMVAIKAMAIIDLHMIALKENTESMEIFSAAIESIVADGIAEALWNEHVETVNDGAEPVAVAIPVIEGAATYTVGISGDCPPIDYTTPDGKPAGYNTAMLAAISERIGVNIEIKQIDSGARFLALTSGEIDFFFWQASMDEFITNSDWSDDAKDRYQKQRDISDKYILSTSYGTVQGGILKMAD